jgi:hypothetical protein
MIKSNGETKMRTQDDLRAAIQAAVCEALVDDLDNSVRSGTMGLLKYDEAIQDDVLSAIGANVCEYIRTELGVLAKRFKAEADR